MGFRDVVSAALTAAGQLIKAESAAPMALTVAGQHPEKLPPEPTRDDPKGLLADPFAIIDQLGYRDRPSSLTYTMLRDIARRVPTELAIIKTRLNQISAFATPPADKRDSGFVIKLRDDKASPSRDDERRMVKLTDWVLQCGSTWGPGRDDFKTFLRKLVRDVLELDQGTFEPVKNRKGIPAEFYALDGATMRLADIRPGDEKDLSTIRYVQVYDEVVIGEFTAEECAWCIRNPRTDIRCNGYGLSEVEELLSILTAILYSVEYNKRCFSRGTLARGMLNLQGSLPESKIDAFRRQFRMMLSGIENAGAIPMTSVEGLQWVDLVKTNRDMEYGQWLDWLTKVNCAVRQIDPSEINFFYGNTGQTSQMFATPVEGKMRQSKDRGLRPLLDDIAQWLNVHLIWRLDPTYKLAFVGLDAKAMDEVVEQGKKKSTYLMMVDELRAEEDLPPLPDGKGKIILDPTFMQNSQAIDAQAQQAQMGQQGQGEQAGIPTAGEPGQEQDQGDQGGPPPDQTDQQMEAIYGEQQKSETGDTLRKSIRRTVVTYDIDLGRPQ